MRYWLSFALFLGIVIAWAVSIAWLFGFNTGATGVLAGLLYCLAVALNVLPPGRHTDDDQGPSEIPPFVPGPGSLNPELRRPAAQRTMPRAVKMSRAQVMDMRPWRLKRLSDAPGRSQAPVRRATPKTAPARASARGMTPAFAFLAAAGMVAGVVGLASLAGGNADEDRRAVAGVTEAPPTTVPTPAEATNVAGVSPQTPEASTPEATPTVEATPDTPTPEATRRMTPKPTVTATPSVTRTPTPGTRSAVDLSGTWVLVDTVMTGRDSGSSFSFRMTFSHTGDSLRAEGDGLAIVGRVNEGTVSATYQRGAGTGTFTWAILPDGSLAGWFHDEGSRNSGTSIALRQ